MTARLYLAPDAYGDPTIWRDTGHDRDEAVLTRTGGNAAGFDALARALERIGRVEALVMCGDTRTLDDIDEPAVLLDDLRAALTDGATR